MFSKTLTIPRLPIQSIWGRITNPLWNCDDIGPTLSLPLVRIHRFKYRQLRMQ